MSEEIIYEADVHKAVALMRAGHRVHSPSVRPRIEREAEKQRLLAIPKDPLVWGFVYVFAAGTHVKIGLALNDVERRWKEIRAGNPILERPLYVTAALEKGVFMLERAAHMALAEYHASGEWFWCAREAAIETVKRLEKEALEK